MTSNIQDYKTLASDAALLEQQGMYQQAKVYWEMAANVASNKNREWANNRAHTCEKRGK